MITDSNTLSTLPELMRQLALLCDQFPDLEIQVHILHRRITVGIPKGSRGDLFAVAWGRTNITYAVGEQENGN